MDNQRKLLANSTYGQVVDPDAAAAYRKALLEEMGPASETAWERVRKFLKLD